VNIIEKTHILGVNVERGLNHYTEAYKIDKTLANKGFYKFNQRSVQADDKG
jgi:hypothetical protein